MTLPELYRQMLRARTFELAIAELWQRGRISGELHLGTGEEAIVAGVVTHLRDDDSVSLTHRCTPALVVRGVPLVPILRELLGEPDGLCGGIAGHMHLASREYRVASSGIVGASLPIAVGFALAAQHRGSDAIAVAFTGEGALNQGMALESLNLAAAWSLPLVVVCIDNGWAITTRSATVTAGTLPARLRAFGWTVEELDGTDVERVHHAAGGLIDRARAGRGPVALYATCPRLDGHFLGDPLVAQAHALTGADAKHTLARILKSALEAGGGGPIARASSMAKLMTTLAKARASPVRGQAADPIAIARRAVRDDERRGIEAAVEREIAAAVESATEGHHG
ncbi:MAG TPA: thiamine pyrophosphate-dependent dehydrogenase E1 component subunit alpha [Kofleriaceae bacterium]|nr:thiamine pyrophosphate-dependent dehydrogenase E1 component subunit alpha [Kofleriaceae bacterium]